MRIHPVISVQHLKPAHEGAYKNPEPGPIEAAQDVPEVNEGDQHYTAERIVQKGTRKLKDGEVTEYFIKWEGYSPRWNHPSADTCTAAIYHKRSPARSPPRAAPIHEVINSECRIDP
ncbi:hypothetical protein CDD83_3822 [Cordyceps sp. RAO-2017]|nr:hypothetical protein CDD83_3822 [Cordyceps sp. RAO-2017]